MEVLYSDNCCTLYTHQIITDLSDFAFYFGSETETVVNRVQRLFKSRHRQCERLTVEAMLHRVFNEHTEVYYTQDGKPYLKTKDCSISISHSKTHIAILLSRLPFVGVDIELLSPRILGLEQRIALCEERPSNYFSLNNKEKIAVLTALWTAKEAVYKSLDDQHNISMLSDIMITKYNQATMMPAEVLVKGYGSLPIHNIVYQSNICTFTNHSRQ